jgi:hypothetical protein
LSRSEGAESGHPRAGGGALKRVEQMGFEEILIGSQFGAIDEIERVRDSLKS